MATLDDRDDLPTLTSASPDGARDDDLQSVAQSLIEAGYVRSVFYATELPSTQSYAQERANEVGLATPLLVLTENQTEGQGRGGKKWIAGLGALSFSLVVDQQQLAHGLREQAESSGGNPDFQAELIPLAVSVAVAKVLSRLIPTSAESKSAEIDATFQHGESDARPVQGATPMIKWPNDIYLGNRKIGGVLVQRLPSRRYVMGCGVNINNKLFGETAGPRAGSLREIFHQEFPLGRIAAEVVKSILIRCRDLADEQGRAAILAFARNSNYLLGRSVVIKSESGRELAAGQVLGLADNGSLLLRAADSTVAVNSGTVEIVEPDCPNRQKRT